jgi:HNH endonuclease
MANTEEMLFQETDGSCAYCGIKDYRVLTTHHIVQQEPKDESYDNKLLLCHNCHHLYHQDKGPSLEDLQNIKKRLISKMLTQQGINALKTSYRKGFVFASPYLINHLLELNLMRLKEHHMTYDSDDHVIQGIYELTENGRNFCEKWDYK